MAANSSKTVIYAALAGNTLIDHQVVAAAFTGSSAMVSKGVHSLVDTGNQILLLYGLRQSPKPATPDHPSGYGLRLYFWAFVVAILIFGLGAGISIFQDIDKIRAPHTIEHAWINYLVLTFGILFEGAVWLVAFAPSGRRRAPADGSPRSAPARIRRSSPCCSRTRRLCWAWRRRCWASSVAVAGHAGTRWSGIGDHRRHPGGDRGVPRL
jgi:hypothetical protein